MSNNAEHTGTSETVKGESIHLRCSAGKSWSAWFRQQSRRVVILHFITLNYNVCLPKDGATDHYTSRLHALNKTILLRL